MRLLIADDDYQIREGLREGIEWQALGIEEVRTAANGIEALEIFNQESFQIILTDIQMPGMTGLAFIEAIREKNRDTRIVFISAYSEFEYARKALQLGADDYILKPVQVRKLEEIIRKNVEIYQENIQKNTAAIGALREKKAREIYVSQGQELGAELCQLYENEYSFVKEQWFQTMVLRLHRAKAITPEEKEEIQNSLCTLILEKNGIMVLSRNEEFIFLLPGSNSMILSIYNQNEWRKKIQFWNEQYQDVFGSFAGAISLSHNRGSFSKVYLEVLQKAEECFYAGLGSIVVCGTPKQKKSLSSSYKKEMIFQLQEAIKKKQPEQTQSLLNKISEDLYKADYPERDAKSFFFNCYYQAAKKNITELEVTELQQKINQSHFAEEICGLILQSIKEDGQNSMCTYFSNPDMSATMKRALEYIHENYQNPIGLAEVSSYVHKSGNYFSSMFKKETGIRFSEYLTNLRLEMAYKEIKQSDKKIKDIAEEVGYSEYVYFSQQFKQKFGIAPTDVRNIEKNKKFFL